MNFTQWMHQNRLDDEYYSRADCEWYAEQSWQYAYKKALIDGINETITQVNKVLLKEYGLEITLNDKDN